MRVEDILRSKGRAVETISPTATVGDAIQRLRLRLIGALVVSTDGVRLDGVISERDVVAGLSRHGAAVLKMPVRLVMSTEVPTCSVQDSVKAVMSEMTSKRVRHLPVMQSGDVVGMVSIGDVVKSRLDELEFEANVMRDSYIVHH